MSKETCLVEALESKDLTHLFDKVSPEELVKLVTGRLELPRLDGSRFRTCVPITSLVLPVNKTLGVDHLEVCYDIMNAYVDLETGVIMGNRLADAVVIRDNYVLSTPYTNSVLALHMAHHLCVLNSRSGLFNNITMSNLLQNYFVPHPIVTLCKFLGLDSRIAYYLLSIEYADVIPFKHRTCSIATLPSRLLLEAVKPVKPLDKVLNECLGIFDTGVHCTYRVANMLDMIRDDVSERLQIPISCRDLDLKAIADVTQILYHNFVDKYKLNASDLLQKPV